MTFFQEVLVARHPTFVVQGMTMRQEIAYRIVSRMQVSATDANGQRTVQQTVVAAELTKADEMSRASFSDGLNKLRGREFTLTLNENNEVIRIDGWEDDVESSPLATAASKGFLMTSVIDRDGWKELATWTFFQPSGQTKPGATWIRQMTHEWDPLGSWMGNTTFRQVAGGEGQRYDFSHDMKYVPPDGPAKSLAFSIRRAEFTPVRTDGSILYDPARRRLSEAREWFQVRGKVEADLLGQTIPIQLEEQQAITVRWVDQWKQ